MRVQLRGLLQEAHGAFGGTANRTKLVTTSDGQTLIVPRKDTMTGPWTYSIMLWNQICWAYLDLLWKTLTDDQRGEWGRCVRRNPSTVRSNLDSFRAVNMPRVTMGAPAIRLPPDRAASHAIYLKTPPPGKRKRIRTRTQLWIDGKMKPEPVPPGETPPPGEPFDFFEGSWAHPFVWPQECGRRICPTSAGNCSPTLMLWLTTEEATKPGKSWLQWDATDAGDPPVRPAYWMQTQRIDGLSIWYGTTPRWFIEALNIQCRTGTWDGYTLPHPGNWAIRLRYDNAPAVRSSYAYYVKPVISGCPHGHYELLAIRDVYGTYTWPDHLEVEAQGMPLTYQPKCRDPDTLGIYVGDLQTVWVDLEDNRWYAGFNWLGSYHLPLHHMATTSGGESYVSATDINCCDTGERAGQYWFKLGIRRKDSLWLLEYRKPAYGAFLGVLGGYVLYDPYKQYPWAPEAILMRTGTSRYDTIPLDLRAANVETFIEVMLALMISWAFGMAYNMFAARFMKMAGLTGKNWPAIAGNARPIWGAVNSEEVRCVSMRAIRTPIPVGNAVAREVERLMALQRLTGLSTRDLRRGIIPFTVPTPLVPPVY